MESQDYFETFKNIENILPSNWQYMVLEKHCYGTPKVEEITLKVALFSEEDIKSWIKEVEEKTCSNYSIRSTEKITGQRVKFKQRLKCHLNTRNSQIFNGTLKTRTRNRKCPSSLNITLRAVPKLFRGKANNAPDPKMPCVINFITTHNHNLFSADVLRLRQVSEKTKNKLVELYKSGHSAATALVCLKIDIQLSNENSELLLADHSVYPRYSYCYHLFNNEFKKLHGLIDYQDDEKTFLINKLEEYNSEVGEKCATIDIDESSVTITLCPPLFKRLHDNINCASEIVFMDATSTFAYENGTIFVLSTNTECGGLPLGIIITSSTTAENIALGFQRLKHMLGSKIFYHTPMGPQVFMIDECAVEHIAIQSVWNKSKCLLCISNVLQAVYRWLIHCKNRIPTDYAMDFFNRFRSIVYATSQTECEENYHAAVSAAAIFPNYIQYLEAYWEKREMWALSYRQFVVTSNNNANNISEVAMHLLKDKILYRIKTFNMVQLVDFLLTTFVLYYERRLLDAAHNRLIRNMLIQTTRLPADNVLEQIQKLDEHVYIVPSEKTISLNYIVYTDTLACSCISGSAGVICKHIDWVHTLYYSDAYKRIDDIHLRTMFYKIATGEMPPTQNWLLPVHKLETPIITKVETMVDDEACNDISLIIKSEHVDSTSVFDPAEQHRNAFIEGRQLIMNLSDYFTEFLEKSPLEVAPALKQIVETLKEMKTDSNIDNKQYICKTCGSHFQEYSTLLRHYKIQHGGLNLPCPQVDCIMTVNNEKQLREHIQESHGVPVICHKCGKIFLNQEALLKHQRNKHSAKVCSLCWTSFDTEIGFEAHMLEHESNQHQCTYCHKVYQTSRGLKRHTITHHGHGVTLRMDDVVTVEDT